MIVMDGLWISTQAVFITRAFFLVSVGAGVLLGNLPSLRQRYMDYGVRTQALRKVRTTPPAAVTSTTVGRLVDYILTLEVPHYFFLHYYLVSVASSLFWGHQLWIGGPVLHLVNGLNRPTLMSQMSGEQVWLCWALMLIQGCRRLFESLAYTKSTRATMPIPIYLIGILFYLMVHVAILVEGNNAGMYGESTASLSTNRLPSGWYLSVMLFAVASSIQFVCHRHLASLQKYSLPTHFLFAHVVCPHYTMECIIYLTFARLAAPADMPLNITLLCVMAFVVVNLGVVADSTRSWWEQKFGKDSVKRRWRMMPAVW